jgi:hypothetical protein
MVVQRLNSYWVSLSISFERAIDKRSSMFEVLSTNKEYHMRYFNIVLLFCVLILFTKCSGQTNNAVEAQKLANEIREKTAIPGESPSANLYMKAVIDGKQWTADKLIQDEDARSSNYHVNGSANGTSIAFYVSTSHIKAGDVCNFGENNAADFMTDDDNVFYGGRTGKFEVTRVDDAGFEGKFYFTASSVRAPKKFEVTEGVLRFPWAKRKLNQ